MPRIFACAGAIALALAFLAPTVGQAADLRVKIDNFVFTPEVLEIPVGATVVWTNDDDIPHLVAATGRQFRSKALDTGDSFSYTFTAPGSFDYFCALHPHMKGKIVVK